MARVVNSEVTICNMALRHLAITKTIQSLTERSSDAQNCNAFYAQVRDEVLGDFPWPFATKRVLLALVAGSPSVPVNLEWIYSYRYPVDCLRIQRIENGVQGARIETSESRIPYAVGADDDGQLIFTDYPFVAASETAPITPAQPIIVYTAEMDDPSRYSAAFAQALAFKLAFYLAPGLTGGDKFKLGQRAGQLYAMQLAQAQDNAINEEQADPLPDSEFILVRDS